MGEREPELDFRPLEDWEVALVCDVLRLGCDERDWEPIVREYEVAHHPWYNEYDRLLVFRAADVTAESRTALGTCPSPTEGVGDDSDGAEMMYLLFIEADPDGGRSLKELEVIRGDGKAILEFPSSTELRRRPSRRELRAMRRSSA